MADISKININGYSYNIKDTGAIRNHQDISGKVNVAGTITVTRGPTSTGYIKFAECELTNDYGNKSIILSVTCEYAPSGYTSNGLVYINIRGNGPGNSSIDRCYWLINESGYNDDSLYWAANDHKIEFYRKIYAVEEYSEVTFNILHIGDFEGAVNWPFRLIYLPNVPGTATSTPIGVLHAITTGGRVGYSNAAGSAAKLVTSSGVEFF